MSGVEPTLTHPKMNSAIRLNHMKLSFFFLGQQWSSIGNFIWLNLIVPDCSKELVKQILQALPRAVALAVESLEQAP